MIVGGFVVGGLSRPFCLYPDRTCDKLFGAAQNCFMHQSLCGVRISGGLGIEPPWLIGATP